MGPSRDDVEEQLQRILASQFFAGSDRLRDLLTFLVRAWLDGRDVKDLVIGIEVFRRADFDPRESSLVRSAANRLRKALRQYYESEGRDAPVVITIPEGAYVPRVEWRPAITPNTPAPPIETPAPTVLAPPAAPSRRMPARWTIATVGLAAAILGALTVYRFSRPQGAPEIQQFTRDGELKQGPLLLDDRNIYFRRAGAAGMVIASVPVAGGDATNIPLPLSDPMLLDAAQRPPFLLSALDMNLERHIWRWTPGHPPEKLESHDNPHALRVGAEVFIDAPAGRLRLRVKGRPDRWVPAPASVGNLSWHPGRNLLRMDFNDQRTQQRQIAEMEGLEGTARPVEGFPENACCGHWNASGDFYAFQQFESDTRSDVWLSDERGPARRISRLTPGGMIYEWPVPSADGRRVYTIGMTEVADLVRYDLQAGGFKPYLGGLSAFETDYSPDRNWVAYVHYPDRTLWKMRSDGAGAVQLTFSPMHAVEPHWSPDGKQIAFLGWKTGSRRRVYLISPDGSALREASAGVLDQGVPTWSRDGRHIVFGEPLTGDPVQTMELHLVAIDKGTNSRLRASAGLWTPRWSPDGRWIAAGVGAGFALDLRQSAP